MKLPIFSRRAEALPDVPTARDEAARINLPPYPSGWFGVAFSHEVAPGEVKRAQFAGREVVVFRTDAGRAAMFDAYCPHLGAHLGHGGCVKGETLRCPMHDFRFEVDGSCAAAGAGHTHRPSAKASVVPVREVDGVILAWHHPERAAPTWEPPALVDPELARGPAQRQRILLRSHVQELAENLVDAAHFDAVHGFKSPALEARPAAEGHVLRGRTRMTHVTGPIGSFERRVEVAVDNAMHGLGVVLFDSVAEPGGLAFRGAITANPVGPGLVDFRLSVWIKKVDAGLAAAPIFRSLPRRTQEGLMGRLLALNIMRDVRQDQAVLEHKRHLARPGLSDGDAAIPVFRRWARQFYPEARDPSADAAAG